MRIVTSLVLALALAGHLVAAVPTSQGEADLLVTTAQASLQEADSKPERIVDAAIAFGEALKWYEQSGDIDRTCEMQANIFWCKKRMDLDQLTVYVAQKSQDAGAKAALATVDEVTSRKVDVGQAQIYFDRAKTFADTHPDAHLKIAIRYFEVAERFQGSDVSLKAQRLSLDAQQRYAKTPAAAKPTAADVPAAAVPEAARAKTELPSPEALKSAAAQLRELLKEDFAKQKPRQRLALYDKLLIQAEGRDNDPAITGALLSEARDLAITLRDPLRTLGACERLVSDFTGVDGLAISKAALARIANLPAATAFAKLLDHPDDADANLSAGRYAAFEATDWEHGLPLLAKGTDTALAKASQLELSKPTVAAKRAEVADQWYDLGKKLGGKSKEAAWWHALDIYEDIAPTIQGLTHALIVKRMEEMTAFLPLPADIDYTKLTAAQWTKIKAPIIEVQARLDRNDTGIRVTPAKPYRVIPHPTDTWHIVSVNRGIDLNTTYKGDTMKRGRMGTLQCQVGNGPDQPAGVVSGDGLLILSGDFPRGRAFAHSGMIRVKIIPVEAE